MAKYLTILRCTRKIGYFIRPFEGKRLIVSIFFVLVLCVLIYYQLSYRYQAINPADVLTRLPRTLEALLPPEDHEVLQEPAAPTSDHATLLVYVHSHPANFKRRQIIRQTWGNLTRHGVQIPTKIVFSMGRHKNIRDLKDTKLSKEIDAFNDILMVNVEDVYEHLSIKSYLTMKWILTVLPEVNYIFKVDDDVILNLNGWINIINSLKPFSVKSYIVGNIWLNSPVQREGKYFTLRSEYPYHLFPPFCSGAGYLMSRSAVVDIMTASKYVPMITRDDPYFTGILAEVMEVTMINVSYDTYLGLLNDTSYDSALKPPFLLFHNSDPSTRLAAWKSLQERPKISQYETRIKTVSESENLFRFMPLSKALNSFIPKSPSAPFTEFKLDIRL